MWPYTLVVSNLCFRLDQVQEDSDDPETRRSNEYQAHSDLATFQTQCAQKLFKKARRVLAALKGVVESFRFAKMSKPEKYWQDKVVQFQIVHRTSTNSDALAYARFHFSRTHGKSPKEVSELTKAARHCGEAYGGKREQFGFLGFEFFA